MKTATDWMDEKFEYTLTAEFDDVPIEGNAMCSGDDEYDKKIENELYERCKRGDVWAWASVKVTASFGELTAYTYLGACSYESQDEFEKCDYYTDMIIEVTEELRTMIAKIKEY